ncbi:MAG: glycoside hydrolase N-terminal domain-containing protein [Muribaculaceae bacterium]|nr:glycoside hydrolase N-terminal domain-containing protein [Muribaculaceae bacterium]
MLLLAATTTKADTPILFFDRPADYFEETFVIGNGTQGGIIYGNPSKERISLNDITFWTGEPDTAVYSPGAYKYIPDIRAALDDGNYDLAEELQQKVQGHYSANYQPIGTLLIDFADKSEARDYVRCLNLADATANVNYTKGCNEITTEYIASAPDSVIAIKISATQPIDFNISFESPIKNCLTQASENGIIAEGYAAYFSLPKYLKIPQEEKMRYDPNRGIKFRTEIRAIASGADIIHDDNGSLTVKKARETTIIIAIATNFNGSHLNTDTYGMDFRTIASRRASSAASKTFDQLRKDHIADYSSFFSRVNIDLGKSEPSLRVLPTDTRLKNYSDNRAYDPDLEELYFDYGRYLLISCSRTKCVPANLQGLWNEYMLPPWSSNYTTNINLEENYWPAEVTNLSEMHMPLLTFIRQLPRTGKETAREYYGVNRGWCLGQNSDIWAITNPVGLNSGAPLWANWNMGGAWLATHIWEHYLFTRDEDFLKEYYPTLKGAAEFCLDWMIEDKDGRLITSPSTSPENYFIAPNGKPIATSAGAVGELAIIRQCLSDTKNAAKVLGTDSEFVDEIDSALSKIAPYKIGSSGQLQEWACDFKEQDPKHRHQAHLYGLYPGHHITLSETPELAKAAAKTLEIKGENTTGWSAAWRVNLLARLAESQKAYAMLRRLLKYVTPDKYNGPDKRRGGGTYPNLLDAHTPFQIDGNFGGTAGITEMLLQSSPTDITLLPALPEQWKDGSFSGLRTRCGVAIDAEWHSGKVKTIRLYPISDGDISLRANGNVMPVKLQSGKTIILEL